MNFKFIIKFFLSLALLTLVLNNTDFEKLKATLLSLPLWSVVTVIFGYFIGQLLSSFKWWYIAKQGGIESSYLGALKSYFIGMFVNCFGLGMVGGDLARALMLSHGRPHKTPALASVLADRLHGLVVLALIGLTATLLFDSHLSSSVYFLIIAITISIILGWFIGPYILLKIVPAKSKYRRKAEQLCSVFPTRPIVLIPITIVSVVFHLLQISLHSVIATALGISLAWSILLTVVPVVNILCSLPISWNGLGLREKGYAYFLTPAFITQEQAVAFGAIWLLALTVSSIIGGFVALLTKEFSDIKSLNAQESIIEQSIIEQSIIVQNGELKSGALKSQEQIPRIT